MSLPTHPQPIWRAEDRVSSALLHDADHLVTVVGTRNSQGYCHHINYYYGIIISVRTKLDHSTVYDKGTSARTLDVMDTAAPRAREDATLRHAVGTISKRPCGCDVSLYR
eukprot:6187371-Pleurochrysis_carterae.AAC.2